MEKRQVGARHYAVAQGQTWFLGRPGLPQLWRPMAGAALFGRRVMWPGGGGGCVYAETIPASTVTLDVAAWPWTLLASESAGLTRTRMTPTVQTNTRLMTNRIHHQESWWIGRPILRRVARAIHQGCSIRNQINAQTPPAISKRTITAIMLAVVLAPLSFSGWSGSR